MSMTNESPADREMPRRLARNINGVCRRCGNPAADRFCTVCGADQRANTLQGPATLTIQRQPPRAPVGPLPELERRTSTLQHALHWVGVHGGAGETTLAEFIPGTVEGQGGWPADLPVGAHRVQPTPVILTTRSTVRGLLAAKRAIATSFAGKVPEVSLIGLVIIADVPGKKPREIRDLERLVCGGVSRSWFIDFIPALRTAEQPADLESAPADFARLRRDIDALFTH